MEDIEEMKNLLDVQVAVTLAEKVLSPPKQDVKVLDVSQVCCP